MSECWDIFLAFLGAKNRGTGLNFDCPSILGVILPWLRLFGRR